MDPRAKARAARLPTLAPRLLAALVLAAGLALAGCGTAVRNPVTGQTERTVLDERAEVAEGTKAHQQILQEYGALADPALQAYVDGVGQKLAAQSHRAQLKWTFTVLDSAEINAFALPGGFVYVTRGIMAYLDSEADLAGVLGHEIGHVTARHGAQRATSQARANVGVLAAVLGGLVLEGMGVQGAAQTLGNVAQTTAAGFVARYGREQELQADQLGAEYLARVRYDPGHMVEVIQVLKSQELFAAEAARAAGRAAPQGGGWLASHPSNDERLQAIRATAQRLAGARGFGSVGGVGGPAGGRAASASASASTSVSGSGSGSVSVSASAWEDDGRARYLKAIDGLSFGDSREQGVVRGRSFFHEPLGVALTAPAGWRIVNSGEQLVLVNAARDAALMMQLVPEAVVKKTGGDHAAILRDALGATQGTTERLTLGGGLAATHFSGQRRNAQGQVGTLIATLANGPGGRMYLFGWDAKDAQALARARGALREAELSFRPMTAADRQAARPWKVKTVPMPAGGFAQLARSSPLTELALQQLRLLNGVYGTDDADPKPGQRVKVVE